MVINMFIPRDIYGGNQIVNFLTRKERRNNKFGNTRGIKSLVIKDEEINE